jgi:hypothetical protein
MKTKLLITILALTLSGCAALDTTFAVLDVFFPDEPTPVCDKDSVGVQVNGEQCVKLSDDTYRWRATK